MDMAGMIAFIFEDMYGSVLQMAALNLYDGTATITYLICVSLQRNQIFDVDFKYSFLWVIEAGMSVTSFSDYQNTITAIQMAKLSAIESASASASEDTISEGKFVLTIFQGNNLILRSWKGANNELWRF